MKQPIKGSSIESRIRSKYKTTGVVPAGTKKMPLKEYVTSFQDVVAESSLGTSKATMAAAAKVATAEWNASFGAKKAAAKKAATAKTMPVSKKK